MNGGYNDALERNMLLLSLASLFNLDHCSRAKGMPLKGLNFEDSAVFKSKLYSGHLTKASQVEGQLGKL